MPAHNAVFVSPKNLLVIKRLLLLIPLVATVTLFAGCGDNVTNTYGETATDTSGATTDTSVITDPATCDTSNALLDTDQDGLTDCDEVDFYGTSVLLKDTDGDGISDFDEIMQFGFNPSNNNFKFNPLIADVPKIEIRFSSAPSISLDFETTTSIGNTITAGQSEEYRTAVARSSSSTNSTAWEVSHTRSEELSAQAGITLEGPSLDVSATVGYGFSNSTTEESSISWSSEQTKENAKTLETARSVETTEGIAVTGGSISVTVDVVNQGQLAFTMKNMSISAVMTTPRGDHIIEPVGTLSRQTTASSFPPFTLGPEQVNQSLIFASDLNVATTKSLLADSSALSLRVVGFELTDENDKAFDLALTDINAKTATIILDYGDKNGRTTERYMVATNTDPKLLKITAAQAMQGALKISNSDTDSLYTYSVDSTTGALSGLRGVRADVTRNAFWIAVHRSSNGVEQSLVTYDPTLANYDFNALELKSGDVLHLIFFEDADFDGLGIRQEFAFGSDPENPDTDGDGLLDAVEVYVYGTAPTLKDTDGDGFRDKQEAIAGSDGNDPLNIPPHRIAVSENMSLAIAPRGTLWSWGSHQRCLGRDVVPANECGQLSLPGQDTVPGQIGSRNDWVSVTKSDSRNTVALIAGDGTLWTWGSADWWDPAIPVNYSWVTYGRTPTAFFPANRPARVNDDTDWLTVSAVRAYTSGDESGKRALKTDGSMWLIEHISVSQVLFDGPDAGSEPDTDWAAIGGELALKKDGTLWMSDAAIATLSTGINVYTTPTTNWTKISPENDWARLAFGGSCCLAIRNVGADGGGSLWAWGNNSAGQLGLNDIVNRIVPEQVMFDGPDEDLLPDTDWTWVAISGRFAFAGKTDGSVWTWGTSRWGQFGPGLADGPYLQPVLLTGNWAAVMMNGSGYSNHAFGLGMDGQLYGWGPNGQAELGLGYRGYGSDIYGIAPLPTLVGDFSTFYTP